MYANEQAIGRNWYTADMAAMHRFDDCCRVNLHWKDGAEAYVIVDTQEEAEILLQRYGFI